jgi:hypothetical protein
MCIEVTIEDYLELWVWLERTFNKGGDKAKQ